MASPTLVPTLHHLSSSQSLRVLFALEELAAAHGTVYKLETYRRSMNGPTPSLVPVFPMGKSPILVIEEDGVRSTTVFQHPQHPGVVTESRLILRFLADHFAQGLWEPADERDRRQDGYVQELTSSSLATKIDFILIFEMIASFMPFGVRQPFGLIIKPITGRFKADLVPIFQLLEDALTEERPWLSGTKMGLADINLTWGMDVATQRGYFDAAKYPKLARWYETITQRPAYQRALEKGGVYDLKKFT